MKKTRKIIAVICVAALLCGTLSTIGFAAKKDVNYTIVNPYANVDWSWEQYKADLHTHTTASDGDSNLKEMIEINYDYGFDIYAVSDHGLCSYSWTEQQVIPALDIFVSMRNPGTEVVALDSTGYTFDGDQYDVVIENGDEYYYQTTADGEGHKMLRVPYANEQNPTSLNNAHVNTWFVDYGHAMVGGTSNYEEIISNVDALGGLSVINHPGEYTNARDEECTADAYDTTDASYSYYIEKFTSLLDRYDSCIGIDMNSKGDSRTRFDRKLWDILLMNLAPKGRNVLGISTSDGHRVSAALTGYTRMLMPANTSENLKACMEEGAFFAASRCLGNNEELGEIANYLLENGDSEAVAIAEDILERQKTDYNAKYEAPYFEDDAQTIVTEAPEIIAIDVDDNDDEITLITNDAMCIRWIADGKTIAYGNTLDLDDYCNKIGSYVRAEVFGKGGITYTQAFLLEYDEAPEANVNDSFNDFGWLLSIVPDSIVKFLASLEIFNLIWEALN